MVLDKYHYNLPTQNAPRQSDFYKPTTDVGAVQKVFLGIALTCIISGAACLVYALRMPIKPPQDKSTIVSQEENSLNETGLGKLVVEDKVTDVNNLD